MRCARGATSSQREHDRTIPPPPLSERTPAAVLRSLAREFPGCLRELDTLGAGRAGAPGGAGGGGGGGGAATEPWMSWIARYHSLMRAALAIRRAGGSAAEDPSDRAEADAAFVADVMAPPDGRLGIVVLRRLARDFGVPAKGIAAALFPLRRPSPYEL